MTNFKLYDKELVTPEVEGNAVPSTTGISPASQHQNINSIALKHHRKLLNDLGLSGTCINGISWCISQCSNDCPPELFEFNITTAEWIDHGGNISGTGFVSLISHIEGYDKMEAAVVLEELLEELDIEFSLRKFRTGRAS